MRDPRRRFQPSLLLPLLALACSAGAPLPPAPTPAGRSGAALATVTVENRTSIPLVIAFRTASGDEAEIVVGRVPAEGAATMAPVPAGEPIVLIARAPDSARYETTPLTLRLNMDWRWRIPADAEFREPRA